MPEHAEAHQAALVRGDQAVLLDLDHQRDEPDQAHRDVKAVRADEREERRQERAAGRASPLMDEVGELVHFDRQEREAEQAGEDQPHLHDALATFLHRQHREAVGDRREQQHRGVHRHQRQLEDLLRAGTAGIAVAEHGIGREQHREDEAIAHQVHPEAQHRAGAVGMLVLLDVVERDLLGLVQAILHGYCGHRVRLPGSRAGGCARSRWRSRPRPGCGSRACS